MKRVVYRVQWRDGAWHFGHDHGDDRDMWHTRKKLVVSAARRHARGLWKEHRVGTQLFIHGKDGLIQTEHTYGADPRRSKG